MSKLCLLCSSPACLRKKWANFIPKNKALTNLLFYLLKQVILSGGSQISLSILMQVHVCFAVQFMFLLRELMLSACGYPNYQIIGSRFCFRANSLYFQYNCLLYTKKIVLSSYSCLMAIAFAEQDLRKKVPILYLWYAEMEITASTSRRFPSFIFAILISTTWNS